MYNRDNYFKQQINLGIIRGGRERVISEALKKSQVLTVIS